MSGEFWNGDCLELMKNIPDGSVDMILCDLPYGTTACAWDTIIPFEPLWEQYKRIIKPNGAIILTASQPFTSALIMSNVEWFKYEWIWEKSRPTGHTQSKNKPMKKHENVLVFSSGTTVHATQSSDRMPYFPQGLIELETPYIRKKRNKAGEISPARPSHRDVVQKFSNYPTSILKYASTNDYIHPTQKPVALFEYLIKTYTNEGETVLDNTAGSGTTAIAAINTNRNWICIEKDADYYSKACARIAAHQEALETPKLDID